MGQNVQLSTAVIGAGVVGLLTAWQLRLSGHAVTILDPAPGAQASYAAAGMLAPISEVQYGQQQLWELMTAAQAEYPALIRTLQQASALPTGYRENGTLLVAADPGDRQATAELVAVQQAAGMEVTPLSSRQLRSAEPALAPGLAKVWSVPGDHQVNPRQLVRCVTEALDAQLDPGVFPTAGPPAQWIAARVTRVEQTEQGIRVEYDGAAAVFDRAALVPGLGYTDIAGLPQQQPLDLRPVHGDVIRLRVRPEQLSPGEQHLISSTLRAKVRGRSVYLVPRAPEDPLEPLGLVVGASSREDGLPGTHTGSVAELLEDAAAVLPAVRDAELVEITTRARPGTPDDRPYLGAVSPGGGVVISTGYHRHGILLAPLAARLTVALLSGEPLSEADRDYLETMRPDR
ncbi:glycine oxidase ThiO [Nesterenkonia alkaliphila]|uniref:glycine oxidase n=1 Tax=Nesterenkonia alkaliphila TaxID=1463631 RepID=A0A7K1UMQ4_9MICC|nr:glycine oxidase ThiO [Nesterenkonia alkaliphila]MVT27736.1 glycine oxidase ThiO [Nesterenkonia alkaliphila]